MLALLVYAASAAWAAPPGIPVLATPGHIPQLFREASASMIPTLQAGDVISAVELAEPPHRGDVIVFKVPSKKDAAWVKRVIGLPGETVQMKMGRLFIDGTIVSRQAIAKLRAEDYYGKETEVPTFMETLPGGVAHSIIEIQGDAGFNDNTDALKVPSDSYFVMGDNRDNSTDSRVPVDQEGIGFVAARDLIGRADTVVAHHGGREPTQMPIR